MGNENSKTEGSTQNGNILEPHVNGKVNDVKVQRKSDLNGAPRENDEKVNGELTVPYSEAIEELENMMVGADGSGVEAQVNGSKDVPVISTEAQVVSPKDVLTVQNQRTDEAGNRDAKPTEPADAAQKQNPGPSEETSSVCVDGKAAEGHTHHDDQQSRAENGPQDSRPDHSPVMNFFKTLVTPTKSQKKETATADVTKDQKETPPTVASTTVPQAPEPAAPKGMSIPPPPPPEPPKMEMKGEPALRPQKPTPKDGAKASAKQPEASKGRSARDTLSGFFRSKDVLEVLLQVDEAQDTVPDESEPVVEVKTVEEEVPQPVVVEVEKADASKANTLEADVKPEPAAPKQEQKPAAKNSFFSRFKPKAAEPRKETAAAPPAAATEAAAPAAKEEPKAAAAKTAEACIENKPPSAETAQGGDESAKAPKKLEKRNSINLFFKTLGQKRNSLDAGVQTESPAPASEKTK